MAGMGFPDSGITFILMMSNNKYGGIAASLLRHYQQWQFVFFTLLTLFSILSGQSTVFYVIYFFWWTEFIRLVVDGLLYRQNPNAELMSKKDNSLFSSFLPMFIYLVFIVVFFGIIANLQNQEITFINIQVLVFRNWFFNFNLLTLLIHRIVLHRTQQPVKLHFGAFTPNMIVLHVSIVVGGVLMFFVVRNYPQTFTPDNLWGSVLIILPFFILKWLVERETRDGLLA
jgi:hypothetical protein